MIRSIEKLLETDTAGDPMGGLRWTRKTTEKVSRELRTAGIQVSPRTVARLLGQLGYALRVNHKKRAARPSHPQRNRQFELIAELRRSFHRRGLPVISIDTKKKELIGQFKNPGRAWTKTGTPVYDHDFRSDAVGIAISFGVYDVSANRGYVVVGTSHETPTFATDALGLWWKNEGCHRYRGKKQILVLADGGGANSCRKHLWKAELQRRFVNCYGITVTVCHYPPGTSKWNPIEHRLFSEISKNWAGEPLVSYEKMLRYIRTTKTKTGLRVRAILLTRNYDTKVQVSKEELASLNLRRHKELPQWNYSIAPRKNRPKM